MGTDATAMNIDGRERMAHRTGRIRSIASTGTGSEGQPARRDTARRIGQYLNADRGLSKQKTTAQLPATPNLLCGFARFQYEQPPISENHTSHRELRCTEGILYVPSSWYYQCTNNNDETNDGKNNPITVMISTRS